MSAGRKSDRCAASRGGAAPNAVSFVNAAAGMNEEAAGNFGRIATEEEVQGDPADRGYVTCLALLNRIRRWWARETGKAPVEEWDEDRRQGLKKDSNPG